MPAAASPAPVIPLRPARTLPIRLVRGGRECPVCAEVRCVAPSDCAAEFTARTWIKCPDCNGSGWDSTGAGIWCPTCVGSTVLEAAQ